MPVAGVAEAVGVIVVAAVVVVSTVVVVAVAKIMPVALTMDFFLLSFFLSSCSHYLLVLSRLGDLQGRRLVSSGVHHGYVGVDKHPSRAKRNWCRRSAESPASATTRQLTLIL